MAVAPDRTVNNADLDPFPPLDQSEIEVQSDFINVSSHEKILKIYCQRAVKRGVETKLDILFLHGASFTSQNWVDIKTLYHVANWGHRAIAVDLPGYGKSTAVDSDKDFVSALVKSLGLERPVIVSPSMSGGFSLPYLFQEGKTSTERARGFVPVAPVSTTQFVSQYKESQLPVLVVCGSNDQRIGPTSTRDLMHLPQAKYAPIEGAGHACYMNNPDAFHVLLYNFFMGLET